MRRVLERLTSMLIRMREGSKKHASVFAFALLVLSGVFLFGHHALATPTAIETSAADLVSWLIGLLTRLVGMFLTTVVIPTLLYAMSFSDIINAAPVVAGWVVVRDFTNLLFIIILLIISFGIIFGQDKYGKIDMLPQLFVTAIAINFSRTIVGFLNDISMVFMQTFVKAFSQAGAGNFVDLFSVDLATDLKSDQVTGDAIGGAVLSAVAGFVTLFIATIILGYLAVIMMIRIVTLWILVIIAPLAWFMKLAETWGNHTYANWWKEVRAQMVMGPIMAFFIWLALATGSAASVEFANSEVDGGKMGNASYAGNGSATTQAAIKAIIAIAILYKGLQIAQEQGGVGSSILGRAGKVAFSPREQLEELKRGGRLAQKLGTPLSAATRAGLRMSSNETAQRYGKATSLSAPLLADAGKFVTNRAGGLASKVPLGIGAFAQRKLQQVGSNISAASEGMSEKDKKMYEEQVTQGSPENRATNLSQLLERETNGEKLNPPQAAQKKALMKSLEKDSEMLQKFTKGDNGKQNMLAFQQAMQRDVDAKPEGSIERRDAQHHLDDLMMKNVSRLPDEAQAELFANMTAHDPDAFARTLAKDDIAMQSFMKSGKPEDIARVAKTNKFNKDSFDAKTFGDGVPTANIAALMGNLPAATRAAMHENEGLNEILHAKLSEIKTSTKSEDAQVQAQLSPDVARDYSPKKEVVQNDGNRKMVPDEKQEKIIKAESKQSFVANLEIHAARGGAGAGVDAMGDTLGIRSSGDFTTDAARENFRQNVLGKDTKLAAETLLKMPPEAFNGQLGKDVVELLPVGVLNEIQRQLVAPGSGVSDDTVKALFAKLASLESKGEFRLQDEMKKNKTLEDYANPATAGEQARRNALAGEASERADAARAEAEKAAAVAEAERKAKEVTPRSL